MTALPEPVTADALAALLGFRPERFYRVRRRLEREEGMPAPFMQRPHLLWDARAISLWMLRHLPDEERREILGVENEEDLTAAWAEEFARRRRTAA